MIIYIHYICRFSIKYDNIYSIGVLQSVFYISERKKVEFDKIYQYSSGLTVLYVEDDLSIQEETIDILEMFFHEIDIASNGAEGYALYSKDPSRYDLVITDINMPVMDGTELIRKIHKIDMNQMIIVVSAYNESSRLIDLIQLGIYSFIMKPMEQEQLLIALYKSSRIVYNQKKMLQYTDSLENTNQELVRKLTQKNEEIMLTQQISIEAIATMVESYDDETGTHVKRIRTYMDIMLKHCDETECPFPVSKELVSFSAILHDIGKLMIPKDILTKAGKLTDEEFEIIKQHTLLGGNVLASANQLFKERFEKDSYLRVASDIATYHHEKWDGTGYPQGKKGEEIPLCARLTALCDVYDAIRSKRVYKPAMSHEYAVETIKNESGRAFDPKIVDLFLANHTMFDTVFQELQ